MPIVALPPSNTKRYYVGLADANGQHHIQVRCASTVSDASAVADLGFTFGLLQPVTFLDYTFNELLVSDQGSDIRNPVAGWLTLPGTNAFPQTDREFPLAITARGRSNTGRKVKLSLWGQFFTIQDNWLYTPAAAGAHRNFLDVLVASPTYFLAIDGSKPVWKDNFTVDYNDHWVHVARP